MNNDTPEPAMQTELGKPLSIDVMGKGRFREDFEREFAKAAAQHDEYMRQNPGVQKNKTVLTLQIEFLNESNPHSNRDDPDSADNNPTAITPKFSIKGMAPKPATYYGYSRTADPSQGAFDAETGEVMKGKTLKLANG